MTSSEGGVSFRGYALLAMLAGALAALGHAPFSLWWLSLCGFAVLIRLVAAGFYRATVSISEDGSRSFDHTESPAHRPFWIAWFGGAAYFAVTMHWIVEPFLVDAATHGWMAPFALILLAGGLALFWGLAGWLTARLATGAGSRALAFATLLTAAELVRGHVFTGFPWALPAYLWAETPVRGSVAVTGSYGLTLLTLLGAAAVTLFRGRLVSFGLSLAVFAGLFLLGQTQLAKDPQSERALGHVRIVQPNVPQNEKWRRDKVPDHLQRLMSLTAEPAPEGTDIDLVVWPEAAVVYPLDQADSVLSQAARAATGALGDDTQVILGINRRDTEDNWYNALVTVAPDGTVKEAYDKVHLVPFGEYIPFRIEFLRAMAASSGFGFTSGESVRLIDTPLGRALPLICYEGIFPRHLFKPGERADYILLITNDAWFGKFSGPYQHLDQARFRAVEHRLPVVRVANTGVSAVINTYGEIDNRLDLGETGHLDAQVTTSLSPTLYSRTGDWPVIVFVLLILSALGVAKRRNTIAKARPAS